MSWTKEEKKFWKQLNSSLNDHLGYKVAFVIRRVSCKNFGSWRVYENHIAIDILKSLDLPSACYVLAHKVAEAIAFSGPPGCASEKLKFGSTPDQYSYSLSTKISGDLPYYRLPWDSHTEYMNLYNPTWYDCFRITLNEIYDLYIYNFHFPSLKGFRPINSPFYPIDYSPADDINKWTLTETRYWSRMGKILTKYFFDDYRVIIRRRNHNEFGFWNVSRNKFIFSISQRLSLPAACYVLLILFGGALNWLDYYYDTSIQGPKIYRQKLTLPDDLHQRNENTCLFLLELFKQFYLFDVVNHLPEYSFFC